MIRRGKWLAAACLPLIVIAACSAQQSGQTDTGADLNSFYSQQISWDKCDEGMCGELKVPLDYAQPQGATIQLSVFERPAQDPNGRLGAIVLNPGGPGASGIDFARSSDQVLSPTLLNKFDIVGFDPRGVGASSPIACINNQQTDELLANLGSPIDELQFNDSVSVAASVGTGCQANSPDLTPNIGTVPAAKDMDILRAALGEPKLNYMGLSYGTFLGLTYADLFSNNVGKFVLDGVIDPSLTNAQLAQGQADGFQLSLSRFIANCITLFDCPLPKSQDAGLKKIDDWLESVARQPIPATPGRPLTKDLAVTGILSAMYEPEDGWPQLRLALADGFRGNGKTMLRMVDSFTGRQANGNFADNSVEALYAVNCLDRPDRENPQQTEQLGQQWNTSAPTFGAEMAWSNLPCYGWPAPATDAPHPIAAAGAAPIVLIGSKYDPATPYQWAVNVSHQLAQSVLVTSSKDGHTGLFRGKCVDGFVDRVYTGDAVPLDPVNC